MRQREVSRRRFVTGTAGAAFGAMIVPRHVLGGAGYLAPSETVNFAVVGCGGQGAAGASDDVAGGPEPVAPAERVFGVVDSGSARVASRRRGELIPPR